MVYAGALVFVAFGLLLYFMRRDTLRRGKVEAREEVAREVIADVKKAGAARNKLGAGNVVTGKLRDKYTKG